MSRSERERRDAERAARRAKRLADRADQRAERKGDQARRAAERAEDLAERVHSRRSPRDRDRDLNTSIEDYVDKVADKWSRKAEGWIDEQSKKLFDEDPGYSNNGMGSAAEEARKARKAAEIARKSADDAAAYAKMEDAQSRRSRRESRRKPRHRRASYRSNFDLDFTSWRRFRRRRGNLYRSTRNKKICGVCSGTAEYLGLATWQVRLAAVLGLVFIPSLAVPAYFITYFLMDKKPYYREMSDRYDERHDVKEEPRPMRKRRTETPSANDEPEISNVQAMKTAKQKFSNIETRLRSMESHVTSSKFELQRELRKISGDES